MLEGVSKAVDERIRMQQEFSCLYKNNKKLEVLIGKRLVCRVLFFFLFKRIDVYSCKATHLIITAALNSFALDSLTNTHFTIYEHLSLYEGAPWTITISLSVGPIEELLHYGAVVEVKSRDIDNYVPDQDTGLLLLVYKKGAALVQRHKIKKKHSFNVGVGRGSCLLGRHKLALSGCSGGAPKSGLVRCAIS